MWLKIIWSTNQLKSTPKVTDLEELAFPNYYYT